ncbi:MAG: carboxypeptidase-like regulatory domain-containing protein [Bacteroidota bacterium]
MNIKLFLSLLIVTISTLSFGQKIIVRGAVSDFETGEKLVSASVYLAQTDIGSSTNLSGSFAFNAPKGQYELVVSYVGYQQIIQPIVFTKDTVMNIKLKPEVKNLSEVLVKPDTTNWASDFETFKRLFIGRTDNAASTVIENPKNLIFFFDPKDRMFFAHAKEDIIIRNDALGYRIYYDLKQFEMNFRTGYLRYLGIPRFEKLSSKSKRKQRKWANNRLDAYQGSFEHFIDALEKDQIEENDFAINEIIRKPTNLDKELIRQKVMEYRRKLRNRVAQQGRIDFAGRDTLSDSLRYWQNLNRKPDYEDSVGKYLNKKAQMMDTANTICCTNILRIIYKGEPEAMGFALQRRRQSQGDNKQTSLVHLLNRKLAIAENGYYDVNNILFEGYLEWASNIAEMLPINYEPD